MVMPQTKAFALFLLLFFVSCTTVPPPRELSRPQRYEAIAAVKTSAPALPRAFDFNFANPKPDLIALLKDDYITFIFISQKSVHFRIRIQIIDKQSGLTMTDWESFVMLRPGVGEDVVIPFTNELVIGALERRVFEVRAHASRFYPAEAHVPFAPKSMTFTAVSPMEDEQPSDRQGKTLPVEIEEF
jgi:hypothetical protein